MFFFKKSCFKKFSSFSLKFFGKNFFRFFLKFFNEIPKKFSNHSIFRNFHPLYVPAVEMHFSAERRSMEVVYNTSAYSLQDRLLHLEQWRTGYPPSTGRDEVTLSSDVFNLLVGDTTPSSTEAITTGNQVDRRLEH